MKNYKLLLEDILNNGVEKNTEKGKVLSVFGRSLIHSMKDGFPLLDTKKSYFKDVVTELLWSLRGNTNIKYLVDNNCHIWDDDCFSNYRIGFKKLHYLSPKMRIEEFIDRIKSDDDFANKWGDLGPIHGKQWRKWDKNDCSYPKCICEDDEIIYCQNKHESIDQIENLINDLKRNPDSRSLMVNTWNVSDMSQMILPPCHYSFQVYTRELTLEERLMWMKQNSKVILPNRDPYIDFSIDELFRPYGVPKRAISLMFNMRSNDVLLGLPFNVASYALLLEIIARMVSMVPDELIVNLGESYIDINKIEEIKKEINTETYPLSKINIKNDVNFDGSIDDMLNSCDVDSFIIN